MNGTDTNTSPPAQGRPRLVLLVLVLVFAVPFLTAVYLRFSGWQPGNTRNVGELLQPPLSLDTVEAVGADGKAWAFENQDYRWTLLVRPATPCEAECEQLLATLLNVRSSLARHAPRLQMFTLAEESADPDWPVLRVQPLPAPILGRPAEGTEVWLVDPHGFLVMHYAAGFDPRGLRRDLGRLIK